MEMSPRRLQRSKTKLVNIYSVYMWMTLSGNKKPERNASGYYERLHKYGSKEV